MGLSKVEKPRKIVRAAKTLVVLITMLVSLLILSAPILLVIADTLLPSALLSVSLPFSSLSIETLKNYDFRYSLIDIPLISIVRSVVIFCVYCLCDGPRLSRGPYMGVTILCSVSSLVYVSIKAPYVFSAEAGVVEVALFLSSIVLAVGHMVVAYRISCRERRKLLIYKIDIEAVQKGFSDYNKLLQEVRMK
ncbi:hypothetical protein ACHQM5_020861 [Ranunculus cassubicifolius]